ncbi:MAG: hypothetical protein ABFQ62_02045 [Patescibacteria group bacterium]
MKIVKNPKPRFEKHSKVKKIRLSENIKVRDRIDKKVVDEMVKLIRLGNQFRQQGLNEQTVFCQ